MTFLPKLAYVEAQQDTVHRGDAENRNESHRGGDAERCAGDNESQNAAQAGERNLGHHYERINQRLRGRKEDAHDQNQGNWYHNREAPVGGLQLAVLASPFQMMPSGRWTSSATRCLASATAPCKS